MQWKEVSGDIRTFPSNRRNTDKDENFKVRIEMNKVISKHVTDDAESLMNNSSNGWKL